MYGLIKRKIDPIKLVILTFLGLIFIGTLLLAMPISSADGKPIKLVDALFTAASAVDVTGLTVLDIGNHFSLFGKLVILVLIQLGGLGYMAIATFFYLVIRKEMSFHHRLFLTESLQQTSLEQIVRLAKHMLASVIIIEGLGAFILFLKWLKPFGFSKALKFGIFHSVSAFNNAGFDLLGNFKSLTGYANDITINLTIMALIILGGIGFCVISEIGLVLTKKRKMSLHTKIVLFTTLLLIISGAFIFSVAENRNPKTIGELEPSGKILAPLFQSVTARTAGFNTVPIDALKRVSLITLIILMFVGASPASTGGGVKTTSFALLFALAVSSIQNKKDTELMGRRIPYEIVNKAITIITLGVVVIIGATLAITAIEDIPATYILFETTSAFGTVGLSMGITPHLSAYSKIILSLVMLIGRVGPLSLVLFFAKQKYLNKVNLPEEGVIVG